MPSPAAEIETEGIVSEAWILGLGLREKELSIFCAVARVLFGSILLRKPLESPDIGWSSMEACRV